MNVVVVGGGTAGWITALKVYTYYYNKFKNISNVKVTVIDSDDIGILGAGEGTTPQFMNFLTDVEISATDIIKNCSGTIKHGINFENWNGDGKSYFHNFGINDQLSEHSYAIQTYILGQGKKINDLSFVKRLTEKNKVAFSYKNNKNVLFRDPMYSFDSFSNIAMHFDARKLASFLKKIAIHRGINRIEGRIKDFQIHENGNVKSIVLENDNIINCDFIFDCSGFSRMIIGKLYNTEWVSYEKYLPLDSAAPFFISHNNDTSPRTDAIAMKNGWIWKIPVEDRYGCGYVFDSEYTDAEGALKEAEELFGMKLESPKTFKFKPGTFKNTLVKNCMAVGLAQSFVEPLEATSIMASINNIEDFLDCDGLNNYYDSIFSKNFNSRCLMRNNEILEFLSLHYLNTRNDSSFWKEFRQKNEIYDTVLEKLELTKRCINIQIQRITTKTFTKESWIEVADGLNLIEQDDHLKSLHKIFSERECENIVKSLLLNQCNIEKTCITHKEFLEYVRSF